ncbi:MAG: FecR family protein [Limnobacter sp.]|nr:FecR family protein [Limnobacter sp.]
MLRLLSAIVLACSGVALSHAAQASAGEVVLATGEVWKVTAGNKTYLGRGDSVLEGDELQTGAGELIVRMNDGGLLSLRKNTNARIDEYKARSMDGAGAIRITLEKGAIRSSTGEVGQKDKSKFRVNTPFSALGIRGTDFVTSVDSRKQLVYVLKGEVALAPFNSAIGCVAASLGECRGDLTKALAASKDSILALTKGKRSAELSRSVPKELLPVEIESQYFAQIEQARFALVGTESSSTFTEGKVYDKEGREIQPYSRSVYRAHIGDGLTSPTSNDLIELNTKGLPNLGLSNDLTEEEQVAIKRGLLLDPVLGDTDSDGIADFVELNTGTNPWLMDTDRDGIRDALDANPRVSATQYWFDGASSPVSEVQIRSALKDVANSLSSFKVGEFGNIGYYSALSGRGASVSMWVDPRHQQLWGQKNTLDTLLAVRTLPEAGTIWNVLPNQASQLSDDAFGWLSRVASSSVSLYSLALKDQGIAYTPNIQAQKDSTQAKAYSIEFSQNLQPLEVETAIQRLSSVEFTAVVRNGDAFKLTYNLLGKQFELIGASSADGTFLARDEQFQVRGIRNDNTLLLMVSQNLTGKQWMLGLVENAQGSLDTFQPSAQLLQSPNGVTWGRWQNFASIKAEDVARLLDAQAGVLANSRFVLQQPVNVTLPQTGRFEFALRDYEAVYSNAETLRPAEISNSFLQIDFDKQKFSTTFDVAAPGVALNNVRGAGDVTSQGLLSGRPELSNAQLQGVLTDQAKGASLLFEKQLGPQEALTGITHWAR